MMLQLFSLAHSICARSVRCAGRGSCERREGDGHQFATDPQVCTPRCMAPQQGPE
jgi:hypothetical protein